MPHVVISCFTADIPATNLAHLTDVLTRLLQQQLGCAPSAVSIDLQQVDPAHWAERVYYPLIQPRLDTLLQRPGYTC